MFIFVFIELKPFKEIKDSILGIILAYALTLFFLVAILLSNGAISQHGSFAKALGILLTVIITAGPFFVLVMLIRDYYLSLEGKKSEAQMELQNNATNSTDAANNSAVNDNPTPVQDSQTLRHHKRASEALMKKTLGKAGLKSDLASGMLLTQVIEMVDSKIPQDIQSTAQEKSYSDVEGGKSDTSPTSIVPSPSNAQTLSVTGVPNSVFSWGSVVSLSPVPSKSIGSTI